MFALLCLALNVYHEARGEPIDGQLLVAETVINRSVQRNQSVCEVVYATKQYSWTHDKLSDIPTDLSSVVLSVVLANTAMRGEHLHSGTTHYHTTDITPYWSKHLARLGQYGNHIFYTEEL
jgi:N-acetylmuramoyl-L-alanine amidase